jgi:hypothetical protein
MASLPKSAGVSAEEARQLIIKAFADRPDVVAISVNFGANVWRIRVFTNHGDKYERANMDALIEREYMLLQELGDVIVEPEYRSVHNYSLEELVPHNHILIFRR